MRKEELLEAYAGALEKKLEKSRSSYEIAKKDTIEAEGRMVTRYDSTKTETAWLADGYLKEVKDLESMLDRLRRQEDTVNLGDRVYTDIYMKDSFAGKEQICLDAEFSRRNRGLFTELLCRQAGDMVSCEISGEVVDYHIRRIEKGEENGGIRMNSLVCLEDEDMEREYYFLVNYLGGVEITVDGKEIFCISKQAPMTQLLLSRKAGEKIATESNFGYRIVSVEQY